MNFILYAFLGVVLFFLINYFTSRYNFDKKDNIVFSLIFLIIVAGISYRIGLVNFNEDIFMIIFFESFIQLFYANYFFGSNKTDKYISFYICKILLAFFINFEFINKVDDVFLVGDELKIIIWLLIIGYLYQFFNGNKTLKSSIEKKSTSKEYIILSFAKFKIIYDDDIVMKDESKKLIIYSIMIFNNYMRPRFFRVFDNLIFKLNNKPRKLGIMQVMSKKYINDYDSIIFVIKKIEKLCDKVKTDRDVFSLYDKDNAVMLCFIYDQLMKFCKL